MEQNNRAIFVTRLGGVAAAVGSAVGLGNVWRFPYETGQNGGAAFILVYLGCVLLLGLPLVMAELMLGRSTHRNPVGTLRKLAPGTWWPVVGMIGTLAMLLVVGFYSVVAGWTLNYTVSAVIGRVPDFGQFSSGLWLPFVCMTIFIVMNAVILLGGVRKGIERASNVMMPLLFLIMIVLCVNSLLLPKAGEGLNFLFKPDFSKINVNVIVSALGQAFFSVSVGIGTLLTYGSYLRDSSGLGRASTSIVLLDTLIAILAGIVIFPACFNFGVEPGAGPGLAFITLPDVFLQMTGGKILCFIFFLLLSVAALTSTLSMFETPIAILQQEFHMKRRTAVICVSVFGWILGVLCCCSFYPELTSSFSAFGMSFFDLFDHVTACYMMPGCGLLFSVFVGWVMPKKVILDTLTNNGSRTGWFIPLFVFAVRFFAPLCILTIFLSGLGLFDKIIDMF